jgi:hypothetical protein
MLPAHYGIPLESVDFVVEGDFDRVANSVASLGHPADERAHDVAVTGGVQ